MPPFTRRSILLSGAALALPIAPIMAEADEQPVRDYLPSEIVVNGTVEGYGSDDGSTATKTPTPLINVPQTVAVITDHQLQDQAIRQLAEALRYIPGISLETGEGHRDEIFIRGQETTADFYFDGLRDDAQYYRSLYNIERIEVLKGANALIFGRGGGGGVVNRVSKTAQPGDAFTELEGSVNSFGAFALAADINHPLGNTVAARLNTTYEEFASNRDFYEGRFIGISPTVSVSVGPDTRLTATYSYDDDARVTDRGVPSLDGGPLRGFDDTFFGDPDLNYATAETHIARARIDHGFNESWKANATLQYANYDKLYSNLLANGTDGTTVQLSGYEDAQERENIIAQANLVGEFATGAIGHTVLVGVEASWQDSLNGRRNVQFPNGSGGFASRATVPLTQVLTIPAFSLAAPNRSNDSSLGVLSGYVQDQIKIGEHLELIAGIRWDRFDLETTNLAGSLTARVDEKISPRLGVVVKPSDVLSFYASYATSFLPQSGDQFFLIEPGDAGLDPEKFTNYEIGAKWLLRPDLFLTAAIFRLDRSNSKAPDPNNTGLVTLAGGSRTEGVEVSLVGNILPGWQASLGYTYLDGQLQTTTDAGPVGTRLQQLPQHQISAWNRVQLTDNFGIGMGAVYQDEQFTSFSGNVVLPSYWRVDAAAFFDISERLSIQLNVENLLDENYYPSAHGDNNIQPGAPLSARLGVRVKL
jgi:catecholate siderophore receptor